MDEDRLPPALQQALTAHGSTRAFRKGAILINEGDEGRALYVILAGRVVVYASSADGRDVVLAEYGPGDYVGELALDGGPRSASVRASEPATCCIIPIADMQDVLAMHPEFALHITRKLSRMVRRATEQVKRLALQDVYGRLVRLLVEASDDIDGVRRRTRDPMTQQDIAERIGASREMVNRVLKELTTGGYVSQQGGRYLIEKRLPAAR